MIPLKVLDPKKISELTLPEKSKLYRNSEIGGYMRTFLGKRRSDLRDRVFVFRGVVGETETLIAWAYLYDNLLSEDQTELGIFVNSNYRNQGFGRKMGEIAIEKAPELNLPPKIIGRPWTASGRKLFLSLKVEILGDAFI